MPTTPTYGFRYPALADDPHVPEDIQFLATDVEAKFVTVDAAVTSASTAATDAAKVVGGIERTSDDTATSGATEKVCITAPSIALEANKTYELEFKIRYMGNTVGDFFTFRIRDDNVTGTVRGVAETTKIDVAGSGYVGILTALFRTGASPGSKVWVGTVVRQGGIGTGTVLIGTHLIIHRVGSSSLISTV